MHSRNEYLKVLRERYLKAKTEKEKSQILDEYRRNTAQTRKYVIRDMQPRVDMRPKQRKKRNQTYDGEVKAPLAKVWEIFDYPCGQRRCCPAKDVSSEAFSPDCHVPMLERPPFCVRH